MKTRVLLAVSLVIATVLGIVTYSQARSSLAGSREFNQWLGITASSKTWLWLLCMLVIGACTGYIVYKLVRKIKKSKSNGKD